MGELEIIRESLSKVDELEERLEALILLTWTYIGKRSFYLFLLLKFYKTCLFVCYRSTSVLYHQSSSFFSHLFKRLAFENHVSHTTTADLSFLPTSELNSVFIFFALYHLFTQVSNNNFQRNSPRSRQVNWYRKETRTYIKNVLNQTTKQRFILRLMGALHPNMD